MCGFSNIGMSPNFWMRAWVLVSLSRQKSYGYELMNAISRLFPEYSASSPSTMGNHYRILRMLETNGFITSEWDTTGTGPARRIYDITPLGRKETEEIVRYIGQTKQVVDRFVGYIEEHGEKLSEREQKSEARPVLKQAVGE
jgi:DNA-binding PadR family transcriptional regulator